jgi:hypothetical protein
MRSGKTWRAAREQAPQRKHKAKGIPSRRSVLHGSCLMLLQALADPHLRTFSISGIRNEFTSASSLARASGRNGRGRGAQRPDDAPQDPSPGRSAGNHRGVPCRGRCGASAAPALPSGRRNPAGTVERAFLAAVAGADGGRRIRSRRAVSGVRCRSADPAAGATRRGADGATRTAGLPALGHRTGDRPQRAHARTVPGGGSRRYHRTDGDDRGPTARRQ